jgi:hypothetical protein
MPLTELMIFFRIKMNRTLKNANEEGGGMRLVSDGAAEAKAEKNVQYLPSPIKPQNDKKNYKLYCSGIFFVQKWDST